MLCGFCSHEIPDRNLIVLSKPFKGWSSSACSPECATGIIDRAAATPPVKRNPAIINAEVAVAQAALLPRDQQIAALDAIVESALDPSVDSVTRTRTGMLVHAAVDKIKNEIGTEVEQHVAQQAQGSGAPLHPQLEADRVALLTMTRRLLKDIFKVDLINPA